MDKFLRPESLDVSLSSSTAPREWNRTFTAFLKAIETHEPDKLDTLINFVSSTIYEYIAECTTYDAAIDILKKLFIKLKNENRDDNVRALFINGLLPDALRQRVLENKTLDLSTAVNQARALDTDQENSESYSDSSSLAVGAVVTSEYRRFMNHRTAPMVATSEINDGTCAAANQKLRCYSCGGFRHDRSVSG
ncbi:uncharacterized protein LOC143020212 [Oratosquilla oratoria]|uniref:uncharacterized protein LOC143020212 n=1 Tax=Oratosquilla oratoria TaxID=337810 RepID=UPI003F777A6C